MDSVYCHQQQNTAGAMWPLAEHICFCLYLVTWQGQYA